MSAPTVMTAGGVAQAAQASSRALLRIGVTAVAFLVLFRNPATTLVLDWWRVPEAGHGLLLAPLAFVMALRLGRAPDARPQLLLGSLLLAGAVLLRIAGGLAAELFTVRLSLFGAIGALIVSYAGWRQLLHWWLPLLLALLSIPVPEVVLSSIALPLQLQASQYGAALMEWRHVPVSVAGNVIHMPGRSLFVTEACSGLRSLTALLSLGVLIGGLWLRSPWLRIVLLAAAVPIAVVLNAIRVFLTGYFVYYVGAGAGEGVMHYTEGWAIFVVACALLGALAWLLGRTELWWRAREQHV